MTVDEMLAARDAAIAALQVFANTMFAAGFSDREVANALALAARTAEGGR